VAFLVQFPGFHNVCSAISTCFLVFGLLTFWIGIWISAKEQLTIWLDVLRCAFVFGSGDGYN
jgi:hypothetical protein